MMQDAQGAAAAVGWRWPMWPKTVAKLEEVLRRRGSLVVRSRAWSNHAMAKKETVVPDKFRLRAVRVAQRAEIDRALYFVPGWVPEKKEDEG